MCFTIFLFHRIIALHGSASFWDLNFRKIIKNISKNGEGVNFLKDDWLVPVIVGSVLGALVIVVIVAYIIGRRRKSGPTYETM